MKRLLLLSSAALVAGLLCCTAALAAPVGMKLTKVSGPPFPVRTFVLALPTARHVTAGDVHVTENGQPVFQPTIVPASRTSAQTFGTALVLDKSYSMSGAPLAAALDAGQTFALQRNPNEQLGLIEFNREPKVVQPLTTSSAKITAALAKTPNVGVGTHIFDAVAQAEAMLKDAGVTSGSIVVLSDGADTGSKQTLSEVAKSARAKHMRIYTVGLADKNYDPRTLQALAAQGGGQYAQAAKPGELADVFRSLGQQLSNQYLIRYTSYKGPRVPVRVAATVKGVGTATTGYRTPPLAGASMANPSKHSAHGIWTSKGIGILLALLLAAVIAVLVFLLLQPKRSGLAERLSEFVSIRGLQKDKGEGEAVTDEEPEPENWRTRFDEMLEIAEIHATPEAIVFGTIIATALTFLLIYAGTGSPWWALFALGVPYLSREWVVRTLARKRNRFAEQLPDALQVIASALRSGHSLPGALAVVVDSASEPMKSEMHRVVADEQLGVPIQQSLGVVAHRMASRDVEQLALVAELQREAGGNAAEVVERVAETVRERFDLKRLIQTLTMQGRMTRWIVSALPIGIILILQVENPHYLHPLLESTAGKVFFGLAAAWAVAGSFVIKRIVEIEV